MPMDSKQPKVMASFSPRGIHTPPAEVAKIVAYRLAGMTKTQIAEEMSMSAATVRRILDRPEVQNQITAETQRQVQKYKRAITDLIPEAIEGLKDLIEQRNENAILKLLAGTQILTPKNELEVAPKNPLSSRSQEELAYIMRHGHLPEDPCTCLELQSPVPELLLAESPESPEPEIIKQ